MDSDTSFERNHSSLSVPCNRLGMSQVKEKHASTRAIACEQMSARQLSPRLAKAMARQLAHGSRLEAARHRSRARFIICTVADPRTCLAAIAFVRTVTRGCLNIASFDLRVGVS